MGWRPPKMEELTSLVDLAAPADPMLPVGHPFIGITSGTDFWAATTHREFLTFAYHMDFDNTTIGAHVKTDSGLFSFWCVRGGDTYDGGH